MTLAVAAFGGNLGDPARTFREVGERLARAHGVASVKPSSLYRTLPVGGPVDQPPFLNAAFAVETTAGAEAFFALLKSIEEELGRMRKEAWGPRTVDLDLVLFGSETHASPTLVTPHPRMHFRRFVLAPTAEVAPTAVHPLLQISMSTLHQAVVDLADGRSRIAYVGEDAKEFSETSEMMRKRHPRAAMIGMSASALPAAAVTHAGAAVGVRPAVHLPGVKDRTLERDLDRVSAAIQQNRLWIAAASEFHPGVQSLGERIVPAVDLRAGDAESRRREFRHFVDSLVEPVISRSTGRVD